MVVTMGYNDTDDEEWGAFPGRRHDWGVADPTPREPVSFDNVPENRPGFATPQAHDLNLPEPAPGLQNYANAVPQHYPQQDQRFAPNQGIAPQPSQPLSPSQGVTPGFTPQQPQGFTSNQGFAPQQPPTYPAGYAMAPFQPMYMTGMSSRSRVAAGLLGLFLGPLGVHNFYTGRTTRGVVQLSMCIGGVLTSWLGIGIVVLMGLSVWTIIEGVLYLAGSGSYGYDAEDRQLT